MELQAIQAMTQFGVAGLMGVLWVIERSLSRRRDQQLDAAHQRLMQQSEQLELMVSLVRRNATAMERFIVQQEQLRSLLEKMNERLGRKQDWPCDASDSRAKGGARCG